MYIYTHTHTHTHTPIHTYAYILYIYIYIYIYIRGGTVHVFVPNHHDSDLSVRCMRPYDEYSQFPPPNPEGGARSNAMLFETASASRRTANAVSCAWKQSPVNSDHVLILNASLTRTDKGLRSQLFAKWGFVLVYPTFLIRHKYKYSIIFPYLRCNLSEC